MNKTIIITILFGFILFLCILTFLYVDIFWVDYITLIFLNWFCIINICASWSDVLTKVLKNQITFLDLFKPTIVKPISAIQVYNIIQKTRKNYQGVKILDLNQFTDYYTSILNNYKLNYIIVYTSIEELTCFLLIMDFIGHNHTLLTV